MSDMILFWGHHAPADGKVGAHVLSQWWPARFNIDGVTYPTAEHWMMAEKARLCKDAKALAVIMGSDDPAVAKRQGRLIENWDPVGWDAIKLAVVARGSYEKFRQNPDLRVYLLSTGDALLVEASPRDAIWGIGMSAADASKLDPSQWPGQNLLGKCLMAARAQLRADG